MQWQWGDVTLRMLGLQLGQVTIVAALRLLCCLLVSADCPFSPNTQGAGVRGQSGSIAPLLFPLSIRLCNYHVQTAWAKQLVAKVAEPALRMDMFKMLRTLQFLNAPHCKSDHVKRKRHMDNLVAAHVQAFVTKYSQAAPEFVVLLCWPHACSLTSLHYRSPAPASEL
jgi:hypothetical protein